jgi:hypothetical protein
MTLYSKAKAFEAGEKVEFNGKKYSPLYTPSNDNLISLFEITDQEQRQLKTIISKGLAAERHRDRERDRRKAAGAIAREIYELEAKKKAEKAWNLRKEGQSWGAVGEALGISSDAARKLASRHNQ